EYEDHLKAALMRWLNDHPSWLLIFDNADTLSRIVPYLPRSGGNVLLTSRLQVFHTLPRQTVPNEIDIMDIDDAKLFMLRRCRKESILDLSKSLQELLNELPK